MPDRLAGDVKKSRFTTRSKYLSALLKKVLLFRTSTGTSSCLEELFELIELFESLPIERIRQLAPTQNRNFGQMVKHLLEIALSYYAEPAEPASFSPITQKSDLPEALIPRIDRSVHRGQSDLNSRRQRIFASKS